MNKQITIKLEDSGAIGCYNSLDHLVAWITVDGKGPVFNTPSTAELFGDDPVRDYPAEFKSLGLDNYTIRAIANCPSPAPTM